jgi:hypothetical protein
MGQRLIRGLTVAQIGGLNITVELPLTISGRGNGTGRP